MDVLGGQGGVHELVHPMICHPQWQLEENQRESRKSLKIWMAGQKKETQESRKHAERKESPYKHREEKNQEKTIGKVGKKRKSKKERCFQNLKRSP